MESRSKRTLKLNRETVRALTSNEMTAVAGGAVLVAVTKTFPCMPVTVLRCPNTTIASLNCLTVRVCY